MKIIRLVEEARRGGGGGRAGEAFPTKECGNFERKAVGENILFLLIWRGPLSEVDEFLISSQVDATPEPEEVSQLPPTWHFCL